MGKGARVMGLVGPVAAGKTVVSRMLADRGAAVISADEINRMLLAPGQPLLAAVIEAFGDQYLRPNGSLDRAALARYVFSDLAALERLEALVHPPMKAEIARRVREALGSGAPLVVIEAAVLYRMSAADLVDCVVMVTADRAERRRRLIECMGLSPEDADQRLALHEQLGLDRVPADYVIDTTAGPEAVCGQVEELWEKFTAPQ
ncbi:MAG: dephospho-CoA kinase [Armatimonadetes bacterium]|nr:dephospho-CoA kinase [Armatimonadota bacterium]